MMVVLVLLNKEINAEEVDLLENHKFEENKPYFEKFKLNFINPLV